MALQGRYLISQFWRPEIPSWSVTRLISPACCEGEYAPCLPCGHPWCCPACDYILQASGISHLHMAFFSACLFRGVCLNTQNCSSRTKAWKRLSTYPTFLLTITHPNPPAFSHEMPRLKKDMWGLTLLSSIYYVNRHSLETLEVCSSFPRWKRQRGFLYGKNKRSRIDQASVWCSELSCCLWCWHFISIPVGVLVTLLQIQLSWKAMENGPCNACEKPGFGPKLCYWKWQSLSVSLFICSAFKVNPFFSLYYFPWYSFL